MLLATDRNGEHNKAGMVILYMHPTAGHAALPGLNVTGTQSQPVPQVVVPLPRFSPLRSFPIPIKFLILPVLFKDVAFLYEELVSFVTLIIRPI